MPYDYRLQMNGRDQAGRKVFVQAPNDAAGYSLLLRLRETKPELFKGRRIFNVLQEQRNAPQIGTLTPTTAKEAGR